MFQKKTVKGVFAGFRKMIKDLEAIRLAELESIKQTQAEIIALEEKTKAHFEEMNAARDGIASLEKAMPKQITK